MGALGTSGRQDSLGRESGDLIPRLAAREFILADSDLVPHVPFDIDASGDGRQIEVLVTQAAAGHLAAWDGDMKRRAVHEAGHLVAASTLGFRAREVDIRSRSGGSTLLGLGEDDEPEAESASRQFDRIVVSLAGHSIDTIVFGEPTTGSRSDIETATRLALERFDGGLDREGPLVSISAFFGEEPEKLREMRMTAAIATIDRAATRAAELVVEHQDKIIAFARLLYAERRLVDDALISAIRAVGLDPVPLGK